MEIADLEKMERMIRMIEIALVIGKNLSLIIAAFIGISFALAIYDSVAGNVIGSLVSLAFGAAGLVFFAQVRQTRRRNYQRRTRYKETRKQIHRGAQAA